MDKIRKIFNDNRFNVCTKYDEAMEYVENSYGKAKRANEEFLRRKKEGIENTPLTRVQYAQAEKKLGVLEKDLANEVRIAYRQKLDFVNTMFRDTLENEFKIDRIKYRKQLDNVFTILWEDIMVDEESTIDVFYDKYWDIMDTVRIFWR